MAFLWTTTVQLLRDVNIDDGNHPYFSSSGGQEGWFQSHTKFTENNVSYQREERPYFKSLHNAEELTDVNYIMFKNPNYGSKWFYARVTSILYANANMSYIYFEIDAFQTYMFDITFNECFVEREMLTNDYAQITSTFPETFPEGLETGEYITRSEQKVPSVYDGQYTYIVAVTQPIDSFEANGQLLDGVFTGCTLWAYNNVSDVNTMLSDYNEAGKDDAVVAIYQIPRAMWEGVGQGTTVPFNVSDIDGYVPKNAKLFTSPYQFISVSNNAGISANYPFELFNNPTTAQFQLVSQRGLQSAMYLYPLNYKGQQDNYDEGIAINNFPICSWVTDTFTNWLAQNRASITTGFLSAITAPIVGAIGGPVTTAIGGLNALSGVTSQVASLIDHSVVPAQSKGSAGGDYITATAKRHFFNVKVVTIRAEYAKRIDDYFSMYGYKTMKLKVPNLQTRPWWNYVKTRDCHVDGSCPRPYLKEIETLFNNGITLWRNGTDIGNYNQDNRG